MKTTDRKIHAAFSEILSGGRKIDEVLKTFYSDPALSDEQLNFSVRMLKGMTERYYTLDGIFRKLVSGNPDKTKDRVRALLYMGLYQIFYSDRPDFAVCNETVKLCEALGYRGLKGFVNGVLRNAVRKKEELTENLSPSERFSVSPWLFKKTAEWYGAEKAEEIFCYFLSESASRLTVRRNRSLCTEKKFLERLSEDGAEALKIPETEDLYELQTKERLTELSSYRNGDFYVQGIGSALSGDALIDLLRPNGRKISVLDLCASPGGKSLHLADLLLSEAAKEGKKADYEIISTDVSEKKVERISENIQKYRFPGIFPEVFDGRIFRPGFEKRFDIVVMDVPCSGLGVLSGKPDLRLRAGAENQKKLTALQRELLKNGMRYVKNGGTLLYSTCTYAPEENEEQKDWILSADPEFHLHSEKLFLPSETFGDGFYYARFYRD